MRVLQWVTIIANVLLQQQFSGASATSLSARAVEQIDEPCTATSPLTGSYFDLRPLLKGQGQDGGDWIAKGHDYKTNFTLSICAPLHSPPGTSFHALPSRANVSAYYIKDDVQYSIGQVDTRPRFRGRKLVLEYKGGSLCPKLDEDGEIIPDKDNSEGYRKSTLISLVCDRELFTKATVTFVGQLNECSYFFEVRTPSACPTVKQEALGPVAVFGIISLVALVVYFVGGCVYQRTVMHARGWRQVPHWQTWAGSLLWIWNVFLAIGTSVGMLFRGITNRRTGSGRFSSRSGTSYSRVNRSNDSQQRRDGWSEMDDENRLIDQLDEDWADDV